MPPTNADDPLRTTDHHPSPTPAGPDVTANLAQGSSLFNGTGAASERASGSVAVQGYQIEAVLGRGGMGVVYKARHLALKPVALKMVLAGGHAGPHELARFRIEAEAVARLQHPNVQHLRADPPWPHRRRLVRGLEPGRRPAGLGQ